MSQFFRSLVVLALGLTSIACQPSSDSPTSLSNTKDGPVDLASALPPAPGANIIIVSFDALRADALGTYGYSRDTSPNIDRFAQQSLVFDRAYSAAPVTPTSFAAAFTSRLPFRSFQKWNLMTTESLAGSLSQAGYNTTAIVNNSHLTDERNFDFGFVDYQYYDAVSDDEMLERGIRWLIEHRKEKFFLWLHFLSPHSPYEYRMQSSQFYDTEYEGPYTTSTTSAFDTDQPNDAKRIRDLYDGEVFYGDQLFGEFLGFLEAEGFLETSIVALTADHGEEFKERGNFQHRHLHEETLRIPLIIRHPQVDRGSRTDTFYSNVDLWPTLAAIVDAPQPKQGDGWNLLLPENPERAFVAVAMTDQRYRGINLRKGDEKLILNCVPEVRVQLFNLADDPKEVSDLAETQTGRVRELLHILRLVGGTEDPCLGIEAALDGRDPTAGLAPKTIESLRALGYLQ